MENSEGLRLAAAPAAGSEGCGFSCADLMSTDVGTIGPDESVAIAAAKMREQNLGFLPVCAEDGRLVGVLTDRDLAMRVLAEQRSFLTPVHVVMSADPITCAVSAEVEVAEALMRGHQKLRIPCVDGQGRLAGVISLADVARYGDQARAGDLLGELAQRETPRPRRGRGQAAAARTRRRAA